MIAGEDGRELETRLEDGPFEDDDAPVQSLPIEETVEQRPLRSRLPWIGALANPRLGPMVVLNESGYFVPLCTAADLLRGCKYYWQRLQD